MLRALERHVASKHALAKPAFSCNRCDKVFTRSDILAKHMKIKHPINDIPEDDEELGQADGDRVVRVGEEDEEARQATTDGGGYRVVHVCEKAKLATAEAKMARKKAKMVREKAKLETAEARMAREKAKMMRVKAKLETAEAKRLDNEARLSEEKARLLSAEAK